MIRYKGKVGRIQMDIITNPDATPAKTSRIFGRLAGAELARLMLDMSTLNDWFATDIAPPKEDEK